MERIGVLGGTFNPVHLGHLILAQTALETYDLARVLFVPCAQPPHKPLVGGISPEHRLAMLELAIQDHPAFEFRDLEIRRGGRSYTVDSLRELRAELPNAELYFIVGGDSLLELHLWKDVLTILDLCTVISFGRGERDPGATITADRLSLPPPWPERLLATYTTGRRVDIASSDIRHRVAEGLSIRYLVPDAVAMYIAEHGLYRGTGA
jgi:nicotinate-nucleotide adenylyltransferase